MNKRSFNNNIFSSLKFEQTNNDQCLPFVFDLSPQRKHLIPIDSSENFPGLQASLLNAVLVGIDTETEPVHCPRPLVNKKQVNKTALLQLAVREKSDTETVYIVDLSSLLNEGNNFYDDKMNSILRDFFQNKNIIKLGQGLQQDFTLLHQSYQYMTCFNTGVKSCLELNMVHNCLQPNVKSLVSLKYLTRSYLNCNLIKTEQCSAWNTRPLTMSQTIYAACDALVLLRLYDTMLYDLADVFGSRGDVGSCGDVSAELAAAGGSGALNVDDVDVVDLDQGCSKLLFEVNVDKKCRHEVVIPQSVTVVEITTTTTITTEQMCKQLKPEKFVTSPNNIGQLNKKIKCV